MSGRLLTRDLSRRRATDGNALLVKREQLTAAATLPKQDAITNDVTPSKNAAEDRLRAFEKDVGGGFKTNDTAIAIIKDAASAFTPTS